MSEGPEARWTGEQYDDLHFARALYIYGDPRNDGEAGKPWWSARVNCSEFMLLFAIELMPPSSLVTTCRHISNGSKFEDSVMMGSPRLGWCTERPRVGLLCRRQIEIRC